MQMTVQATIHAIYMLRFHPQKGPVITHSFIMSDDEALRNPANIHDGLVVQMGLFQAGCRNDEYLVPFVACGPSPVKVYETDQCYHAVLIPVIVTAKKQRCQFDVLAIVSNDSPFLRQKADQIAEVLRSMSHEQPELFEKKNEKQLTPKLTEMLVRVLGTGNPSSEFRSTIEKMVNDAFRQAQKAQNSL